MAAYRLKLRRGVGDRLALPDAEKRSVRLTIRLTEKDARAVTKAAEDTDLSMGEWARERLLAEVDG